MNFLAKTTLCAVILSVPAVAEAQSEEHRALELVMEIRKGVAVPKLVRALKDPDATIRLDAAFGLGLAGLHAVHTPSAFVGMLKDDAVPALIDALQDSDRRVRIEATKALGEIGPEASQALPLLLEALRDEQSDVGAHADVAIARIEPDCLPLLKQALEDKSELVRRRASNALRNARIVGLIEQLNGMPAQPQRDKEIERELATGLWGIGADAIPPLIRECSKIMWPGMEEWRAGAGLLLGVSRQMGAVAVPPLVTSLSEGRPFALQCAAGALKRLAGREPDADLQKALHRAVPQLIEILEGNACESVRSEVIGVLHKIGSPPPAALPALLRVVRNPESGREGWTAATMIAQIGSEAIPELIETLQNKDAKVRMWAVGALEEIVSSGARSNSPKQKNPSAIAAIVDSLADDDEYVRRIATRALEQVGLYTKKVVVLLTRRLKDGNDVVRSRAAMALGKIGSDASEAVPALIEALADKSQHVRQQAKKALDKIDPDWKGRTRP